ncbi:MAG TPA: TIGR04283 family arsenosugar biosynthesis glycosyltransferase [Beijerinckiaceae bacterium]
MGTLSIIVPVLNEAGAIASHLTALAPVRERGAEIVLVDGGSEDGTLDEAEGLADRTVIAPRGRASQMNAGARLAKGETLLFLHADTRLPPDADRIVQRALETRSWGRFDVVIEGAHPMLPVVAAMMNRRSRLTGIATGDQGIFVRATTFRAVGGFPDIPLMEDIALSTRLRTLGRPACLSERVTTSGRRWETRGVGRTILTMWRLRLAYAFGADPHRLAVAYGYRPRDV